MSSRAAQRKKKKQAKILARQGKSTVNTAFAPKKSRKSESSDDDDSEDDDASDASEEFEDENDNDEDIVQPSKKARFAVEDRKVANKNNNSSLSNKQKNESFDDLFAIPLLKPSFLLLMQSSVTDILSLEDVRDIPCDQKAALLLAKLISPTDRTLFYQLFWEQNPLHCARSGNDNDEALSSFAGKLFPLQEFKRILMEHVFVPQEDILLYGKSFDHLRSQPSIDGPAVLKTFLKPDVKCGIRLLDAQKWSSSIWQLASVLEFEFQSRVSTEVCIQSPEFLGLENSLHVADYDQFVLQLQGSSGWNIAEERRQTTDHIVVEDEIDEDDENGKKSGVGKTSSYLLAVGDSLYIPKGRPFRQSSLHPTETNIYIVLQTNRNRAMSNLMSLVIPQAIENLAVESNRMRRILPLTLNQYVGVAGSETETEENPLGDKRRQLFLQYIEKQIMPLISEQVLDIVDPAVDQMNKNFIMERLPVPLSTHEETSTAAGFSEGTIFPYTQLRMLRPGIATVTIEDGKIVLYHCMDNARSVFGNEISPLEFELDDGPAIETLLKAYPDPVMVSDLPHPSEDLEDKVGVAQALFKEGFLFIVDETSKPGNNNEDVTDDEENMNSLL
jgi:lysine-specific demethylase/histidyl-hydroxylase NO66